jgi:hypothetical protein
MADRAIWEVTLFVDGPVRVRGRVLTTQQEGFRNPFESEIEIGSIPSGLQATVTVRADNGELAHQAAVVFFGRMLDALTLTVDCPMYLGLTGRKQARSERHHERRVIEQDEIERAFDEAGRFAGAKQARPYFRSLGWYRKGLLTEDPLDKFLAFWNAITIVAGKYYDADILPGINKERGKKGCISQVWECFKAMWGECEKWPVIPGLKKWIDESNDTRNDIAHGNASIDIRTVQEVAKRLPQIEKVCYEFLRGWHPHFLDLDRQVPSADSPPRVPEGDGVEPEAE